MDHNQEIHADFPFPLLHEPYGTNLRRHTSDALPTRFMRARSMPS
jgi:hypothetical protein